MTEFKTKFGSVRILTKDGGYWFKAGSVTGTVSSKLDLSDITPECVNISLVEVDDGDQFWLMHRIGGKAVMTL